MLATCLRGVPGAAVVLVGLPQSLIIITLLQPPQTKLIVKKVTPRHNTRDFIARRDGMRREKEMKTMVKLRN